LTACRGHANPRWEFQEGGEWYRLPFRDIAADFTAGRRSSIEIRYCLGRRKDGHLQEPPGMAPWVHLRDGTPCTHGPSYQVQGVDGSMVDVCLDNRFVATVKEARENQPHLGGIT
jgi:hypothetical protein